MKRVGRAGLAGVALAALASPAGAQTATWTPAGANAYLSNGANWSTGSFPGGGTAIFGASTETHPTMAIAFGGSTGFTVDNFTFLAGAPAYTFDVVPIAGSPDPTHSAYATFTGAGIVNQSAFAPTFNVSASLVFTSTADAGNAIINNNGLLTVTGTATLGNARVINQAGGIADFSNFAFGTVGTALGSIEGAGSLRLGARNLAIGSNNLSTTFSGTIADGGEQGGTGGSLTKTGTGTLTLTGTNTYTGGTTVSAGTLAAGHVDGNGAFDVFGTGNVRLTGGTLLATVTGNLKNNLSATSGTSTIAAATGTTLTLGGSVASGAQGTITLGGTATLQFGTATDTGVIEVGRSQLVFVIATPSIVVAGGTLRSVQNSDLSVLTSLAVSTTVNAGATLDFNNSSQQSINNLTGAGNVVTGSTPSATSSNDLRLIGGGTANVFSGTISGARGVLVASGTQVLSGANTYTGNTTINQSATLQIGNGGASGSIAAASNVLVGGTLAFNRSDIFTFSNVISDDPNQPGAEGQVAQIGTGTTILNATNTYSGGTTVSAGTLVAAHLDNTGAFDSFGNGGMMLNGGTLRSSVTGTLTNDIIANAGTSTIAAATGTTLTIGRGVNQFHALANAVMRFGTSADTGTVEFGGVAFVDVDQSSQVVVAGGTLRDSQGQLFRLTASASSVIVNAGATLDFNDAPRQVINNLTGAGNILTGATPSAVLDDDLAIAATRGATNVFSGTISGARGVNLDAPGATQVFSGTNTYTGNTSIFQVTTLQIGNGGASGSIAAVSNVFNAGTLAFNRSDAFTFANSIADDPNQPGIHGKVTQIGTGTTILTAANTYTGATTVNSGTLAVNGSIALSSGVTVNNGGTLAGTGTVSATTVTSGGTLAAGNGTAGSSLNVTGSLALQSGAFYMVQINPATSSFASVTGAATLGGSTVKAIYANGSYIAKRYTILTAGSVSGAFASVAETNLPSNLHSTLSYDATHAYLNLVLNFVPPPGTGLSGNQGAVGNAIVNFFNSNGGMPLVYSGLTAGGLTQASGETASGSQQTTFQAMTQFMGTMTDPFIAGRNDPTGTGATGYAEERRDPNDALAAIDHKAPAAEPFAQRWNVWAAGYGGSQTTSGNAVQGTGNSSSSLYGTAVGADYRFSPDTVAGFALAGGGTSFSVDNGGGGRSDLFQAGAFVRHTAGAAYLTGALAYGWQDVTTDRTVTIAGIDRLRATFNANAWSGRGEGGYRFVAPWGGGLGLTPYAAAQFTSFGLPAYAEQVVSGANTFALAYAARNVTATRTELGLRTDKSWGMADGVFTLRGRGAWAHDFNPDRSIGATFQALPGASFVVNGARQAPDSALATASAEMKWLNGWSAAATFEGEFSAVTRAYAGKGVVRYAW